MDGNSVPQGFSVLAVLPLSRFARSVGADRVPDPAVTRKADPAVHSGLLGIAVAGPHLSQRSRIGQGKVAARTRGRPSHAKAWSLDKLQALDE